MSQLRLVTACDRSATLPADASPGSTGWVRACIDRWRAWRRRREAEFLAARVARLEAIALDELSELSPRVLADIGAGEGLRDRARLREDTAHQSRLEAEQGYRGWSLRW